MGNWRKSTLSYNGSSCLELRGNQLRKPVDWFIGNAWRKSTHSSYNGNCIQIRRRFGRLLDRAVRRSVQLRDTKDNGNGPILSCGAKGWQEFLAAAKSGEFNDL